MLLAVPISQVAACQLIERAPRLDRVHLGEIWLRRPQHLEVVVLDRFISTFYGQTLSASQRLAKVLEVED